ncbi:MAG: ribosome biogenesis GTPase Der [Deltaproteobacteria bacterium]|nr:ribosome biogenesis GTPase Der [Deltaproteobacteria bacterium]
MPGIIAIVGRPNVGKSTLFNRITGTRRAIVESEPGVTRDLNMALVEHRGRTFTLIDTGGFEPGSREEIPLQVMTQAKLAIEEADLVVLLMDAAEGITPTDEAVAAQVRRSGKPFLVAANKIDAPTHEARVLEFYRLGVDQVFPLSAEHGEGSNDLLDAALAHLPDETPKAPAGEEEARIAVLGRPNVGKSSLVNRLLGYERVIVSGTPGTTRDAIDTEFDFEGRRYMLIDTAGIRRKTHIARRVEHFSVVSALRSLDRCDVALLVLDGVEGMTDQDARVAMLADRRGRALIFLVNKWDLVDKDDRTAGQVAKEIHRVFPLLAYAPILTLSAKTGQRTARLLPLIDEVLAEHRRHLPTSALNKTFEQAIAAAPPSGGRRAFRISYATQTGSRPPAFLVFGKGGEAPTEELRRYLVNRIREHHGFAGTPIRVIFRQDAASGRRGKGRGGRSA